MAKGRWQRPSASARIAALEAELDGALFERGGRRLRLPPLGKVFLPYAERALAVLDDGLDTVHSYVAGVDQPTRHLGQTSPR